MWLSAGGGWDGPLGAGRVQLPQTEGDKSEAQGRERAKRTTGESNSTMWAPYGRVQFEFVVLKTPVADACPGGRARLVKRLP